MLIASKGPLDFLSLGSRYRPVQNEEAFRVLEPLLDSGRASFETAGALRGGRDVWLLIRFDVDDPVVQEVFSGELIPFGLISNNHAGERRVILQETPIRVVCKNTLGAAHLTAKAGKIFAIRHTVNVLGRTVDAAEQLWGALIERYRVIAEQYQVLRESFLTQELFGELVLDVLAPIRPEWRAMRATKVQQGALERAEARRTRLHQLWLKGSEHRRDKSMWEAYNAVVETVDHDAKLWPAREDRLASLFDGTLLNKKQRVLEGLMSRALKSRR